MLGRKKDEEQLSTLMRKEAEVEALRKENKNLEKEIKQIEQSRTWKYAAPLRRLYAGLHRLKRIGKSVWFGAKAKDLQEQNNRLAVDMKKLEQQLQQTQKQLQLEQKRVQQLELELEKVDRDHLQFVVKKAKQEGQMTEVLDELIEKKLAHEDRYHTAMTYAGRLFSKERPVLKNMVYEKILSGLKSDEVPEFIVREANENDSLSLRAAASFRASLSQRARMRQLGYSLSEYRLDDKGEAYTFIDHLRVDRPWVSKESYRFADIPKQEGIVIKPVHGAGSRGVYLVFDLTYIYDVKRSQVYNRWEALGESIQEDLASGWVNRDAWMLEELILEEDENEKKPARDVKCYCFYGKVGLILEVERFPEISYCWWTPKGERISTGKYDAQLFHGQGVSQEEIELAASISSKIPAPFVRIDFLKTSRRLVFGEFTPKPGNYDQFDLATDRWLGDYFLDAEARLTTDLLQGKSFKTMKRVE